MPPTQPIISIKAGKCNVDGTTVMPVPEPGLLYVYLHPEEELHHFCWKPRSATEPEDDLLVIPGDARFVKYEPATSGRIFVLKFSSSSKRQFYWLQAPSENSDNPGFWSERDESWGRRINKILQGEEDDGGDEEMGDAPVQSGDIEQEGDQSRRGGADGGRAPAPTFDIASLISQITVPGQQKQQQLAPQGPTMSLHDLLTPSATIASLENASADVIDSLISNLPPALVPKDASSAQKKATIIKVLQSPQFTQANVSLTVALREGGLRGVADSLRVPIIPGEEGAGVDQVELFVKGVKREAEKEGKQ
ncbi:proteasome complex subunit Rpn13 ubiquitin receptor-domain-containing protein [Geopyxis carbonaria]|nr:proteasome complex subunit Rpn13 ubiquitin receptor-domain-containing protein [Geopyxis carbonaria]